MNKRNLKRKDYSRKYSKVKVAQRAMGFDDAMRTLGYSGKETGLMSQKTFETSYQLQKAEQLVKEFPSFFYQPEPKIIRTILEMEESIMSDLFAADSQPVQPVNAFIKAGRYAVFQFVAICTWVMGGKIVLPFVDGIAAHTVPEDIKAMLDTLNQKALDIVKGGNDYEITKQALLDKISEITEKQSSFPFMMWHPAFDPDTRDAFLSHTLVRSDNVGFVSHPAASVIKALPNSTPKMDVAYQQGSLLQKVYVSHYSTMELLLNAPGYSQSVSWYKSNGFKLLEDRLQLYLHCCRLDDGGQMESIGTAEDANAKVKRDQGNVYTQSMPTLFYIDYDEVKLDEIRQSKGKKSLRDPAQKQKDKDSIVFLCPESYSLQTVDDSGRKAWATIAAKASQEIAMRTGTDVSLQERSEKITQLLTQVVKRSVQMKNDSLTDVNIPSYKVKYASALRGIFVVSWHRTDPAGEDNLSLQVSYTLKTRPIFQRTPDAVFLQLFRRQKAGVFALGAHVQAQYSLKEPQKENAFTRQIVLSKIADHLTISGSFEHERATVVREAAIDIGAPLVNTLTRMGALNVLDRTYQSIRYLDDLRLFVPLVYENPFGVAGLRILQAEQFVYMNLFKTKIEPANLFTTHIASGVVITNPFTAYTEKAPIQAFITSIYATCYMNNRYGALLKESKESEKNMGASLQEFSAAKLAVQALIQVDQTGVHVNKSTLTQEYIRKLAKLNSFQELRDDMERFVPLQLKTFSKNDPETSRPTWVAEDPEVRAVMQLEIEYFDKFVVEFRATAKRYKFNPYVVDCLLGTLHLMVDPAAKLIWRDHPKAVQTVKWQLSDGAQISWEAGVRELEALFGPTVEYLNMPKTGATPGPAEAPDILFYSAPVGSQRDPQRAMSVTLHNASVIARAERVHTIGGYTFQGIIQSAIQRKKYVDAKYSGVPFKQGQHIQTAVTVGTAAYLFPSNANQTSLLIPVTAVDVILCSFHQKAASSGGMTPDFAMKASLQIRGIVMRVMALYLRILEMYVFGMRRKGSSYDYHFVLEMLLSWLADLKRHMSLIAQQDDESRGGYFSGISDMLNWIEDPYAIPVVSPRAPTTATTQAEKERILQARVDVKIKARNLFTAPNQQNRTEAMRAQAARISGSMAAATEVIDDLNRTAQRVRQNPNVSMASNQTLNQSRAFGNQSRIQGGGTQLAGNNTVIFDESFMEEFKNPMNDSIREIRPTSSSTQRPTSQFGTGLGMNQAYLDNAKLLQSQFARPQPKPQGRDSLGYQGIQPSSQRSDRNTQ